jgi:hypothetical protein
MSVLSQWLSNVAILALLSGLSGCAHTQAETTLSPPTFKQRMSNIDQLMEAGRDDEALRDLTAAKAGADPQGLDAIAYAEATIALEKEDFARAKQIFAARLAAAKAEHRENAEAWLHNALVWVHWATGDQAGALAENEEVSTVIRKSSLPADEKRGVLLHYYWDKAYLLVEEHKDAEADAARAEFVAAAHEPDDHDGLQVLAAFFAIERGDAAGARAAAATVDAGKDDDLQDLYVLARALELGGDSAGAEAIRKRIHAGMPYPMKPLMLRQIEKDAKGSQTKK